MKISVCLASYNGEKYIKEQIQSILPQLSISDELIISDDGSKDSTISIIKSFHDERIKLLHNNSHGVNQNFENALRNATGDIILLSDQDDIWLKGKVEYVKKMLTRYNLIVHNANVVDSNGDSLGHDYFSLTPHRTGFWGNLWKSRFLGCCMAFDKKLLNDALPFPKLIVGHDYWIGMLGAAKYDIIFDNKVFLSYRRHGGNFSSSAEVSNNSWYYKFFKKRLLILWCIIVRCLKIDK